MDFYSVNKVTMSCPNCHAGIKLNVTTEDEAAMQKLLTASDSFACPICKEKFGGARKLLDAVYTYNESTKLLKNYHALFNVEFE